MAKTPGSDKMISEVFVLSSSMYIFLELKIVQFYDVYNFKDF